MEERHDPMDEEYWKKKIEESIRMFGKDKLITPKHERELIKKLKKI